MKKIINVWKSLQQKRTVKKINKALSISLYDWQIDYIFNDGEYHGEYSHGRKNGKTLANILKLLLLLPEDEPIKIRKNSRQFSNECSYLYGYLREDDINYFRRRYFSDELLRTYHSLVKVKGLKLRKVELI